MRWGVGSDGRGKAQWLVVQEGKSAILVGGKGWWDCLHFSTRLSKSNDPPGHNRGKHDNQTYDDGVWAETDGGWRGGFGFMRGFCPLFGRVGFKAQRF